MADQKDLDEKLDKAEEKYFRENRRMQNRVIDELDDYRHEIRDILDKYADDNGKISKKDTKKVLRELDKLEDDIAETLKESVDEELDKTTDKAMKWTMAALGSLIAADAISKKDLRKKVKKAVKERKELKNVPLDDRIDRVSGSLLDGLRDNVRSGVIYGSSTTKIGRVVKQSFEKNEWQIRRVVMSEGNNAFRSASGELASLSDAVKAVKIIDNRGRHPYHESHECYRLAEQDMYGWGKGVYRPEDTFIYFPHPQCTAYYRFILKDDGGDG